MRQQWEVIISFHDLGSRLERRFSVREALLFVEDGAELERNRFFVRKLRLSVMEQLHRLIAAHQQWTGSPVAAEVLRYWSFYARYRFDKVVSVLPRADVGDD